MLKASLFYKEVMKPLNANYGASMVAWEGNFWLAMLTVLKNAQQGDFSDAEMQTMEAWQIHFQAVARKLAWAKEARLDEDSLHSFIWHLPISALMLDWDLEPRHFNSAALELCNVWQDGLTAFVKKKTKRSLRVPQDILRAISELKPKIETAGLSRPGPLRSIELKTLLHRSLPGLSAIIYFVPAKSLSISRGRFLVQLKYDQLSLSSTALNNLSRLSRTERDVALYAAKGLSNLEIGKALGKSAGTVKVQLSQVFKKLNLKSRVQLVNALFSGRDLDGTVLAF